MQWMTYILQYSIITTQKNSNMNVFFERNIM